MKLRSLFFFGSLASGLMSHASAANILVNGNFETGLTGSHNYGVGSEIGNLNYGPPSYGSNLPTGWTRGPSETRIWSITDIGSPTTFASGDYAIRLDAASAGNPNGVQETLRQSGLNLTAGTIYTFSIDLWGQSNGATLLAQLVGASTITIGGSIFTDNVAGIRNISQTFTVPTDGIYELQLSSGDVNTSNHTFIDNVSIDPVPEPSALALVGLGSLGLLARRRRH